MRMLLLALSLGAAQACAQDAALRLVCFDYPPFMEEEGGVGKGVAVEVIREAFVRMKRPITIEFMPPLRGYQQLLSGQADGMFTMKKTPERESATIFSKEPLLVQDFVFMASTQSRLEFNGKLEELADVSIGVVNQGSYGAVFDAAAQSGMFKRLEKSPDFMTNFRKLIARRMDAVVTSRVAGLAILKKLGAHQKFKVIGPPIETTQSYLIFHKKPDNRALADEFDRTLAAMKKDGSIRRIEKKYTE